MTLFARLKRWPAALGLALALTGPVSAEAQQGWFDIKGDDGRPVANQRVPIELTLEVDRLKGVLWMGAANPVVTLVEFMDYNCPFCRAAAADVEALVRDIPGLRVKFVQNAIISPQSEEAAKVVLATFRTAGSRPALRLHQRLFQKRGRNSGETARLVAAELGVDAVHLDRASDSPEIGDTLKAHMTLSASMGLVATPSFLINGVSISGYPGPKTLRRIIEAELACDAVTC